MTKFRRNERAGVRAARRRLGGKLCDERFGLDLLPELQAVAPGARVLILTGLHAVELHRRAVRNGAMGVVLKEKDPEVLISAISSAYAGEIWIDRSLMASLLKDDATG